MTSIVFPGQGSQFVGMSKDFYDNFSASKLVIDEIEDITSISIKNIMFEDYQKQIDLTQYTQICIFAASISIFRAISENFNLEDLKINYMFGHSLGEYSALAASNKISINNASRLLKMRGEFMQDAIAPNTSTMAAIIGLSSKEVENIINNSDLKIHIANDNSNQQVVISGLIKDIENSKKIFENHGAKKFVILKVSAAFHCPLMNEAQEKLKLLIEETDFDQNNISIISNYSSQISNKNIEIKKSLINQMASKVRWTESIDNLAKTNDFKVIEIGPGKVLSGLIRRINKNFSINSINSIDDLKSLKL